ncbi:phage tail protein [Lysinibacillus odysseyi]|uniref:Tail collar protein n=1 Tax=Lysinibacillus odysseyi 34hs-1 = NBRC 100172 TaxID=1220589 RepID=A0A0A3J9P6_9BACI|nr:tail fiber protein [Lysinibacillus odysseyi]KGR83742.1 tail collar protein [Lysinibacillus odysseyi 34hs-1 = NBRC 100172]
MEPYVGEIRMFAGNYAPEGWAFCDGQVLKIEQNELLYALIGVTYGGDGQTTFALPDFCGRAVLHQGVNPLTETSFNMGSTGGVESVSLTLDQLPAHTHTLNAYSLAGNSELPANAVWAKTNQAQYAEVPTINPEKFGKMNSKSVSQVGGVQVHENMMPYLTISYIIALVGLYPAQP